MVTSPYEIQRYAHNILAKRWLKHKLRCLIREGYFHTKTSSVTSYKREKRFEYADYSSFISFIAFIGDLEAFKYLTKKNIIDLDRHQQTLSLENKVISIYDFMNTDRDSCPLLAALVAKNYEFAEYLIALIKPTAAQLERVGNEAKRYPQMDGDELDAFFCGISDLE